MSAIFSEADLRKRALSAAFGGDPSVAYIFHFGRPKTNFSGFEKLKSKKKKKLLFDLHACATSSF